MVTKYTIECCVKGFYFWNTLTINVYRKRNNCTQKYPYHIFLMVHRQQSDKRHSHHGELEML